MKRVSVLVFAAVMALILGTIAVGNDEDHSMDSDFEIPNFAVLRAGTAAGPTDDPLPAKIPFVGAKLAEIQDPEFVSTDNTQTTHIHNIWVVCNRDGYKLQADWTQFENEDTGHTIYTFFRNYTSVYSPSTWISPAFSKGEKRFFVSLGVLRQGLQDDAGKYEATLTLTLLPPGL